MIRDIIDWTKAYLVVCLLAMPIVIMFVAALIVLIEGQAVRSDMFTALLTVEASATLIWLLAITRVVVKTCYKKIKEGL